MRRTTTLPAAAALAALSLAVTAPSAGATTRTGDGDRTRASVIASAEDSTVLLDAARLASYRELTRAAGDAFPGTIGVTGTGADAQVTVRTPGAFSALGDPAALGSLLRVQSLAARGGVRTEAAPRSAAALRAAYEAPLEAALAADPSLAGQVSGYGINQQRGTYVVRLKDASDTGTIDRLSTLLPQGFEVQEAPDAATPLADATGDDPTKKLNSRSFDLGLGGHRAGAQLWMVTDTLMVGTCTIGYGYRWNDADYMVTAGHCAPRGGGRTVMLAGMNVDANPKSKLDLQVKGGQDDLAVARMDMSDGMYETGSMDARTQLDDYDSGDQGGRSICHSGARTQGSCGWKVDAGGKQKVAFSIPDNQGKAHRVYLEVYVATAPVGTKADHGDSGGPVYVQQDDGRKTLVGSLTGGGVNRVTRTKYMFFTGLDAALDAMPGGHPITRKTP